MVQRRARDAEAKEARRQDILRTAAELHEQVDFHALTMAAIAREAGLAKGTLYLYFKTKEELFLEVFHQHLAEWFSQLRERIGEMPAPAEPEDLGNVVAETLLARPILLRLLTLWLPTLEHNIDARTAAMSRRRLRDHMLPLGELLERKLPQLGIGDGFRVLLWVQTMIIGMYQMAHPGPAVQDALRSLDLAMFRLDLAHEISTTLATVIRGWRSLT